MAQQQLNEEQFILRVKDKELNDLFNNYIENADSQELSEQFNISIGQYQHGDSVLQDRVGHLEFKGKIYPIIVQKLPCVVESYKSYNDVVFVKSTDIGQVFIVGENIDSDQSLQNLIEDLQTQDIKQKQKVKDQQLSRIYDYLIQQLEVNELSPDGITPPMKNAKQRFHKALPKVDPQTVEEVENVFLDVLMGRAPIGTTFEDQEEQYTYNQESGKYQWTPIEPREHVYAYVNQFNQNQSQLQNEQDDAQMTDLDAQENNDQQQQQQQNNQIKQQQNSELEQKQNGEQQRLNHGQQQLGNQQQQNNAYQQLNNWQQQLEDDKQHQNSLQQQQDLRQQMEDQSQQNLNSQSKDKLQNSELNNNFSMATNKIGDNQDYLKDEIQQQS